MRKLLVKFYHLNTMGRIEGPPLAGILLLAGAMYAISSLPGNILLAALFMAIFCMNYVYLVNGVTDVKEDAINSPERPLSRGLVGIQEAKKYVNLLFVLTIIYPFFIHNTWMERGVVWFILFLGYIYSCPPVRFKRIPPLATIYLVANFNLPIILGYWMATASTQSPPFLLSTVFLFFANMPLKDYGDRVGDKEAGINNWVTVAGGTKNLLAITSALSVLGSIVCYFVLPAQMEHRLFFTLLPLMPALNIVVHTLTGMDMDQMFTRGVRALILLALMYVIAGLFL